MNEVANVDLLLVLGTFTAVMCAFGWYVHTHREPEPEPEPKREVEVVSTRYSLECRRGQDGRYWAAVPSLPGVFAHGENEGEVKAKVCALALRALADRLESHDTKAHSFIFHVGA